MTEKQDVLFKRYLGMGFYLKREGDAHWLGHERRDRRDSMVQRVRISKEAYDELMKLLRKESGD